MMPSLVPGARLSQLWSICLDSGVFGTKGGQQSPTLPGSIGILGFRVLDFGFRV